MNPDHFLTPYTKINSKCMKDLNVSKESTKILEENTNNKLFDLGHNNFFLDTSPDARETKPNMNHWDILGGKKAFAQQRKQSTKLKAASTMGEDICNSPIR